MLAIGTGVRVFLKCGVTDLRKSFGGLVQLVEEELERNILDGELFLFCNRNRKLLKAIQWDGSGLCVLAKRLEGGCYFWPPTKSEAKEITYAELTMLIEGLDSKATAHRSWYRRRPLTKST